MFRIEAIADTYRDFVDKQIADSWGGPFIASRGVLHDTRTHPGFVVCGDEGILGYILYHIKGMNCEITVLESLRERQGVGKALVNAVIQEAINVGCCRVWLITTNDNTHAIRFYQRIGFTLKAVHIGTMEQARKLKPQIPLLGCDDIPIMHEFEFQSELT